MQLKSIFALFDQANQWKLLFVAFLLIGLVVFSMGLILLQQAPGLPHVFFCLLLICIGAGLVVICATATCEFMGIVSSESHVEKKVSTDLSASKKVSDVRASEDLLA